MLFIKLNVIIYLDNRLVEDSDSYMIGESKGKNIFYSVVAIATLIVAIIGASLAYFSIYTSSKNGAVNASAAIVSISYDDSQQIVAQADKLIPAAFETVVKPAYLRSLDPDTAIAYDDNGKALCVDDANPNYQVCSVYRFSVRSDSSRDIIAKLKNEYNGFRYLNYAVYDVSNSSWINFGDNVEYNSINYCNNDNKVGEELITADDCYTIVEGKKEYANENVLDAAGTHAVNSLFGLKYDDINDSYSYNYRTIITPNIEDYQIYDVILFIKETGDEQNIDQGANYSGTLHVEVLTDGDAGKITGTMN